MIAGDRWTAPKTSTPRRTFVPEATWTFGPGTAGPARVVVVGRNPDAHPVRRGHTGDHEQFPTEGSTGVSGRTSASLRGWMGSSACSSANLHLFFPDPDEHGFARAGLTTRAKAICARCPVISECLAYALATRQDYGVWGGATEQERQMMALWTHRAPSRDRQARRGLAP